MNTSETIEQLKDLIDALPEYNSPSSLKELKDIFSDYKLILDNVHNSGVEDFKRNTVGHYMELSDLNKALYDAEYGKTEKLCNSGFTDAVQSLKSDMIALKAILFSFNKSSQTPDQDSLGNYIPVRRNII